MIRDRQRYWRKLDFDNTIRVPSDLKDIVSYVVLIHNIIVQRFTVNHIRFYITSYARNSKYSSRGLASIGRPLTNNVLTYGQKKSTNSLDCGNSKTIVI